MLTRLKRKLRSYVRSFKYAAFDLRYGGLSGGYRRNPNPGSTGTGATDYALMPQIFDGRIRAEDVLVDVGCGKGRVINWWLSRGVENKVYGLEMMPDVAEHVRCRLRHWSQVTIITGDAMENLPADGTLFYIFNSFDWVEVVEKFRERVVERIAHKEKVRILYFAPVHVSVFQRDPRWQVEIVELKLPDVGLFEERHRRLAVITWKN